MSAGVDRISSFQDRVAFTSWKFDPGPNSQRSLGWLCWALVHLRLGARSAVLLTADSQVAAYSKFSAGEFAAEGAWPDGVGHTG